MIFDAFLQLMHDRPLLAAPFIAIVALAIAIGPAVVIHIAARM